MPYVHGVDNCHLTSFRIGRQLNLCENRSPTQNFQRNQLPASHQFQPYVRAFGLGLMLMMALVMMAMVMVLVMMMIVPEALRQVGWLHQY